MRCTIVMMVASGCGDIYHADTFVSGDGYHFSLFLDCCRHTCSTVRAISSRDLEVVERMSLINIIIRNLSYYHRDDSASKELEDEFTKDAVDVDVEVIPGDK